MSTWWLSETYNMGLWVFNLCRFHMVDAVHTGYEIHTNIPPRLECLCVKPNAIDVFSPCPNRIEIYALHLTGWCCYDVVSSCLSHSCLGSILAHHYCILILHSPIMLYTHSSPPIQETYLGSIAPAFPLGLYHSIISSHCGLPRYPIAYIAPYSHIYW